LAPEVAIRLTAALKKVYDSPAFKDFMTGRGLGTVWRDADQFESFMDRADAQMGQAMKAAGFAKA
jgi:tripartite-type tricarboxylate transporter receptor subunit TctC